MLYNFVPGENTPAYLCKTHVVMNPFASGKHSNLSVKINIENNQKLLNNTNNIMCPYFFPWTNTPAYLSAMPETNKF
jgi:hypothetical protein